MRSCYITRPIESFVLFRMLRKSARTILRKTALILLRNRFQQGTLLVGDFHPKWFQWFNPCQPSLQLQMRELQLWSLSGLVLMRIILALFENLPTQRFINYGTVPTHDFPVMFRLHQVVPHMSPGSFRTGPSAVGALEYVKVLQHR